MPSFAPAIAGVLGIVLALVVCHRLWNDPYSFRFSFEIDDAGIRGSFVDVASGVEVGSARRNLTSGDITVYIAGVDAPSTVFSWDDAWQRLSDPSSLPTDPLRYLRPMAGETTKVRMDPEFREYLINEAQSKNRLKRVQ